MEFVDTWHADNRVRMKKLQSKNQSFYIGSGSIKREITRSGKDKLEKSEINFSLLSPESLSTGDFLAAVHCRLAELGDKAGIDLKPSSSSINLGRLPDLSLHREGETTPRRCDGAWWSFAGNFLLRPPSSEILMPT